MAPVWEITAIRKGLYSWEKQDKRKRRGKPIYQRWWFYAPLVLLLVGAAVAWVGWVIFSAEFEQRAEEFNLAEMEHMEAASVIYDRNGVEMGKIFIQNRHPVPLSEISPLMVKAVIAAEDNKFYQHGGVDYMGVLRAAIANYRRGRISQGASTVTQQLARNSFELKERTYKRKILEMFLAQRIEKHTSKDKIMELYLNRVYFGSGFYGVEAAAKGYFGRSAKELTVAQCAMLAGLLKSPQAISPFNNKEAATQARNFVLGRMKDLGFITGRELDQELQIPLYVVKRTNPFKVSYAIDYIRQQAIAALGFDQAMNGGFRIETTMDIKMQRAAEQSMRDVLTKVETSTPGYSHPTFEQYRALAKNDEERLNKGDLSVKLPEPKYLQGAVLALENLTGGIVVMVGGRDFKHSEFNRAMMGKRPAGTAFAPFVFASAYEKGIFPGEVVDDACIDNRFVMVGGDSGILGEWGVERPDNDYEGPMPTREALVKGKNAATVRLGFQTGLEQLKKVSASAGITSPIRNYANAFLGSSELTLDELTVAYTIFPNGGTHPKQPFIINRIKNIEGNTIFQSRTEQVRSISPEAAFQVNAGLQDALRRGTGSLAYTQYGLEDMPAGGKTGTAYNFTDTYFFGYNSSVTCGVWVGFDRPTKIFRGAFGRDLALPIWTRVMNAAATELPAVAFNRPATLKPVEVCTTSGLLATPLCHVPTDPSNPDAPTQSLTYTEWATEAQMPTIRCDIHGGGVRHYVKEYDDSEYPRAAAAVDLALIRPVAVESPTLLGLSDVYNSVRADAQRFHDGIPVAKAIAVEKEEGGEASEEVPVAPAVPVTEGSEPEVRRAEPVTPLESPLDAPALQAKPPEPIDF